MYDWNAGFAPIVKWQQKLWEMVSNYREERAALQTQLAAKGDAARREALAHGNNEFCKRQEGHLFQTRNRIIAEV